MVVNGVPANLLLRDLVAVAISFALSLLWLRMMDTLAARGIVGSRTSRKIIHIGTGPLFVLCWLLFTPSPAARWLAALVPLAITVRFALIGIGRLRDDEAVTAMTRHGDRREILRGPVYYGIVFVVCTLGFWRTDPVGIAALMILCGGDGLADIVGRRFGRRRLPHNPGKSWAGSSAMFAGGFGLAVAMLALFSAAGTFTTPLPPDTPRSIVWIALGCTIVESLPVQDLDNLTISATAIVLGLVLL